LSAAQVRTAVRQRDQVDLIVLRGNDNSSAPVASAKSSAIPDNEHTPFAERILHYFRDDFRQSSQTCHPNARSITRSLSSPVLNHKSRFCFKLSFEQQAELRK